MTLRLSAPITRAFRRFQKRIAEDSIKGHGRAQGKSLAPLITLLIGVLLGAAWSGAWFEHRAEHRILGERGVCDMRLAELRKDAESRLHYLADQVPMAREEQMAADTRSCQEALDAQMKLDRARCMLWWRGWKGKR